MWVNNQPIDISTNAAEVLLHELRVHQIELEMQNEALRQTQQALEESRDRFVELYEFAPVGYLTLTADGMMTEINLTAVTLLGKERSKLFMRSLSTLVMDADKEKWVRHFMRIKQQPERSSIELSFQRGDGSAFQAHLDCEARATEVHVTLSDITERCQMDQERIDYLLRLAAASRHMISVQEDMRRRISRELHDRTSSNLAAININLNIILSELSQTHSTDLVERMEDIRALISDTTISIRDVCAELHPPLLSYAGLVMALGSYIQQFARRTGIEVRFDGSNHQSRHTLELESLLFRIVQESLTNCAKHAQATLVTVTLSDGNDPIILTITDNGIGFDPSLLGANGCIGLGILNMREMTEIEGGKFTLESALGKGTHIVVEILM